MGSSLYSGTRYRGGHGDYIHFKLQSPIAFVHPIMLPANRKAEAERIAGLLQASERERMNEICAALGVPESILSHRSKSDANNSRG